MIHIVTTEVTPRQLQEMLDGLQTYIKLAVDIRRRIVAGGGEMHADCEAVLLENGSQQSDVWGADWFPESGKIRFHSLINIRSKQGNRSMEIQDPVLQAHITAIVQERLTRHAS